VLFPFADWQLTNFRRISNLAPGGPNFRSIRFWDCPLSEESTQEFVGLDWLVVLGDRERVLYEVVKACKAGVGVAHLSGGDNQSGALLDEPVRHAITKFAHVHFPCTQKSAERLIDHGEENLNEDFTRIYCVGSTMIDDLVDFRPIKKDFRQYVLVQMHPAPNWQEHLVGIVKHYQESPIVDEVRIMRPNSDTGFGPAPHLPYIDNLPREEFLQLLWNSERFVGNSSAMYLEAQYLGVDCEQIGERNCDREEAFPGHVWPEGAIEAREDLRSMDGLRKDWMDGAHAITWRNCSMPASTRIVEVLEEIGKPTKDFLRKDWL
jgi:UDP-N-acetylglucosamine 2-epimerase